MLEYKEVREAYVHAAQDAGASAEQATQDFDEFMARESRQAQINAFELFQNYAEADAESLRGSELPVFFPGASLRSLEGVSGLVQMQIDHICYRGEFLTELFDQGRVQL